MKKRAMQRIRQAGCSTLLLLTGLAQAQTPPGPELPAPGPDTGLRATGVDSLKKELADQAAQLDELKRALADQQETIRQLRSVMGDDVLSRKRGGQGAGTATPAEAAAVDAGNPPPAPAPQAQGAQPPRQVITDPQTQVQMQSSGQPAQAAQPQQGESAAGEAVAQEPVGRPPEQDNRPPAVAPIFDQPGVLTPEHKFVIEPSFQYAYTSSDTVALVGFTVIPAVLIGLIDVREVKTSTYIWAMAMRYGITKRLEIEAKVPYVSSSGSTISREVFTGTSVDNAFNASGSGMGDVEATLRYQLNYGNEHMPYFIGWLRYKSNTGKDPFEVVTDCVQRCVANTTGTGLPLGLPTGSGFQAIQPGITWLLPTDPAVFFGTFSYLHNFARNDVSRTVLNGQQEFLGKIAPGDIFEFSFGMGLSLNEHASFSIGYDQSIIWPTKQNDQTVPGSVRITQGTLLVGYSYRFNSKYTLNLSVGAGLTRDTPDLQVTLRLPITF